MRKHLPNGVANLTILFLHIPSILIERKHFHKSSLNTFKMIISVVLVTLTIHHCCKQSVLN